MRVSCYVTTNSTRPDVIDINLNNILSFGFGAHAGLGPSCLAANKKPNTRRLEQELQEPTNQDTEKSTVVKATKVLGWMVFGVDVIFLICCVNLLYTVYLRPHIRKTITWFMWSAAVTVFFSFMYSLLYVIACVSIGGAFPIFELLFCFLDVFVWIYFLTVVNSYRQSLPPNT